MGNQRILKCSADRIASLFSIKKKEKHDREGVGERQNYVQLNFLLLTEFFKAVKARGKNQGQSLSSFFSLFISKNLQAENPHLIETTEQISSCCRKQDLHLASFRQFFLRNEFSVRQVIEWRLSKCIKNQGQLKSLVEIIRETPLDIFRFHLVTPIDRGHERDLLEWDIGKEEREQENKRNLWRHQIDGSPFRVSRT